MTTGGAVVPTDAAADDTCAVDSGGVVVGGADADDEAGSCGRELDGESCGGVGSAGPADDGGPADNAELRWGAELVKGAVLVGGAVLVEDAGPAGDAGRVEVQPTPTTRIARQLTVSHRLPLDAPVMAPR